MNYHDKIIEVILENKENTLWEINMHNCKFETNVSLSEWGDLDIVISGIDNETQKNSLAILEIKSNIGLRLGYIKKQLPKYIEKFPNAKQFLVIGTSNQSLLFEDLTFEKFI